MSSSYLVGKETKIKGNAIEGYKVRSTVLVPSDLTWKFNVIEFIVLVGLVHF